MKKYLVIVTLVLAGFAGADVLNHLPSYAYEAGPLSDKFDRAFRSNGQLKLSGRVHEVINKTTFVLENREYPGRYVMVIGVSTSLYTVNAKIKELAVWPAEKTEYGIGSGGGTCWITRVAVDYFQAADLRREWAKKMGGKF
jgi:hypothetical protein